MSDFDHIIIGSGSAGAAIAYRLAMAGRRVLILEHGGCDWGPFVQMPAALSYPMNMPYYDWGYQSEPEPHLGGRVLATPRGKVLGGSSSINGMVYVRGHPMDFDHWHDAGARGWNYESVLPYFKRMEGHNHPNEVDSAYRGLHGPLHISRGHRKNPLYQAFVDAGVAAGYPHTSDYNGQNQEGFGDMEMTVHKGRRWSVANAYIRPILKSGLVKIQKCLVERIIFNGVRATAVQVTMHGQSQQLTCKGEIILSAGAINSPKILLQSGIGPAGELQKLGINPIINRAGVGKNLQDHLEVYFQFQCKQPITLYSHLNWFSKILIGAEWTFFKSGLGATNHFESCGFIKSAPEVAYPDIQYHFLPVAMRYDGKSAFQNHGFQVHLGTNRSPSRGEITLKTPNPTDKPRILFNYMSQDEDWRDFRRAVRLTRHIFAQAPMQPYLDHEVNPGSQCASDEQIDAFIKEHCESAYHPCGACKMGDKNDNMAVVDPNCRVIGAENLFLADSSIFPRITNGNLNGPSIMVGEKASDHILGKISA